MKTNIFNKTALALLLAGLVQLPAFAMKGGESGGGGAGICYAGKCKTITEAGFRIEDSSHDKELEPEVIEELLKIRKMLPQEIGLRTSDVVGNVEDIVFVEVANDRKVARFLKEYKNILSKNSSDLSKDVELFAFTAPTPNNRLVTYLIKEKYEALSPRGQALLLIHEYSIRVKKVDLETALRFDGGLLDYLNSYEQDPSKADLIKLLAGMKGFDYLSEMDRQSALLGAILSKFSDSNVNLQFNNKDEVVVDYQTLIQLKKYVPNITDMLAPGNYKAVKISRTNLLSSFVDYLETKIHKASPYYSVTLTNSTFAEFFAAFGDDPIVKTARRCKDVNDSSSLIVSFSAPKRLNYLTLLNCRVDNLTWIVSERDARIEFTMESLAVFEHLQGLDLNLDRSYKCEWGFHQGIVQCK